MSNASSFTQEEARVCTTCGVEKPLSEFHVRPDRSHVPKTKCKDCQAEYLRGWRAANPEKDDVATLEAAIRYLKETV